MSLMAQIILNSDMKKHVQQNVSHLINHVL